MSTATDTITSELSAIRNDIKALAKIVRKIKAQLDDPNGEKAAARVKNNGFSRPQDVTPELRKFLGLKAGGQTCRSDVTKAINKYVNEKGLKHPDNGRVLVLDKTLKDLLKPPAGTEVTFLNLQKFLSPHYIKKEA